MVGCLVNVALLSYQQSILFSLSNNCVKLQLFCSPVLYSCKIVLVFLMDNAITGCDADDLCDVTL